MGPDRETGQGLSRTTGNTPVLGVDACRGGWIGFLLRTGREPVALTAPSIAQLVDDACAVVLDLALVAIDIPIGLHESRHRKADVDVARVLGPRRSSVFRTPVRPALEEPTYARANERQRQLTGKGVSAQAYALRTKILEVDAWRRAHDVPHVVEVHPETSFATLNGTPLRYAKHTWAGLQERLAVLRTAGLVPPTDLGEQAARPAPAPDDVLDALVAAWTAGRVVTNSARCFPDPPELLPDGTSCAIWA